MGIIVAKRVRRMTFLALATLFGALVLTATAQASRVALFFDSRYVDTDSTADPIGAEAVNLRASLLAQGHSVKTFTGISDRAWSRGLAGQQLLVIPELDIAELEPDLSVAAKRTLRKYVKTGGGMALFDRSNRTSDLLNAIFGFAIAPGADTPPYARFASAAGTAYAGGPATLPSNDATEPFSAATLPARSRTIYANGDDVAVVLIRFGSGEVTYHAWDWYDASPIGSQDGGWLNVLNRSMTQLRGAGCTVSGTRSADALHGTSGADRICGFGGADVIHARAAADIVRAGRGRDWVYGQGGGDRLLLGGGRDRGFGGPGDDFFKGGRGNDLCVQGPGNGPEISC